MQESIPKIPPPSALGKVLSYTKHQWPYWKTTSKTEILKSIITASRMPSGPLPWEEKIGYSPLPSKVRKPVAR